MLTQIHFLLTYACNYECDHCFLYCSPRSEGTFTISQIRKILEETKNLGTVEWIYFEGGEPFLYFPILQEGIKLAHEMGFKTGIVTNCYWATSKEDAELWLKPLLKSGIDAVSLSDDSFHSSDPENSPAKRAAEAAASLGIQSSTICIEAPTLKPPTDSKGDPVVDGGALFKGRAAEKLVANLPGKSPDTFTECTHEELVAPKRVHVDAFGNVHICQGISIGNFLEMPFSSIIKEYNADKHPISGPLTCKGPAGLAEAYQIKPKGDFVDECHYCYLVRRELLNKFPQWLAPSQVYGLTNEKK